MKSKKLNLPNNWLLISKYRSALMGFAAIFIIVFHTTLYCSDIYTLDSFINTLFFRIMNCVNIGVEIFLFVSGVGLYFAYEKQPRFKDYYIKRILNVYMLFFICNIFKYIFYDILIHKYDFKIFIEDLFGLNFILGRNNSGWYVVFAMILYLVYPIIYKITKKLENSKWNTVVWFSVILVWFIFLIIIRNTKFYESHEVALTRVPIFLLGCYAGSLVKQKKEFKWWIYAAAIVGFFARAYVIYDNRLIAKRFSSFLFGITVIYVLLFVCSVLPEKMLSFFEKAGNISLELYLVHGALYVNLMQFDYLRTWYVYLALTIVAVIVSIYLSKFRKYIVGIYVRKHS